jgi:hypothetical protein
MGFSLYGILNFSKTHTPYEIPLNLNFRRNAYNGFVRSDRPSSATLTINMLMLSQNIKSQI